MSTAVDAQRRVSVLDRGFIELEDYLADDLAVVNAARVSLHKKSEAFTESDQGLIKFLMREHHGTPFEHTYFRFRVKAPIFVFREWHRHRVGHSYNEWSARYSQLAPEFYIPHEPLVQIGKPGAYTFEPAESEASAEYRKMLEEFNSLAYACYERSLEIGIAKQHARGFNTVFQYSEMIWSCNARSIMHFLNLRNSPQAQAEIREYARAAEMFFFDVMPVTAQAFVDGGRIVP